MRKKRTNKKKKMGGGVLPGGVLPGLGCVLPRGVLPGGVCASQGERVVLLGGMCFPEGEGCASWGVCFPGGCVLPGVLPGGVCGIPACTEADPPMNRMTDRCKNITFATLLRTVIMLFSRDTEGKLPQKSTI